MRNLRLHWDAEQGWMLDVPAMLSAPALQRVIDYALPHQVDRYRSLPPGAKKDELKGAIEALIVGKIKQLLVGPRGDGKGDLPLFTAALDPDDRKIISFGK